MTNQAADVTIPSTKIYVEALDGVRGIAIATVLLYHSFPDLRPELGAVGRVLSKLVEIGPFGVDLFFVLSGFLITGILLEARDQPQYFRNFYARRALRLFPVYYLYLIVLAALVPLVHRALHTSMSHYSGNWWWYVLYFGNWKPNWGWGDAGLGHIWSLAVEEQFYLVWPMIVLIAGRGRLAYVCVALIAQATVLRCVWSHNDVPWNQIYRLTITRYDTMAFGALAALALRSERFRAPAVRFATPFMAVGALVFLVMAVVAGGVEWERGLIQTFGSTAASICFVGLVVSAATRQEGALNRLCRFPLLLKLGKYSYFIYVVHDLVILQVAWIGAALEKKMPGLSVPLKLLVFVLSNVVVYYMAKLSWRFVEAPTLGLKRYFESKPVIAT